MDRTEAPGNQPTLEDSEHFAVVRRFLDQVGYSEPAVCARLGLTRLHELSARRTEPLPLISEEFKDTLDALIKVFLSGTLAHAEQLRPFLSSPVWQCMNALGLLCAAASNPDVYYSPVSLFPIDRLYFVSDRRRNLDGTRVIMTRDFVFPAFHHLTHEFLELLPSTPCERLLDLCSGTGIAALQAANRFAKQSWAVEINARAVHFANFNRLLNQVTNITVLRGSVYEPVKGMRFERIVTHPPYAPSLQVRRPLYADGGEDGEEVTRAIVQGLPEFLEPGGRFYCMTMGMDKKDEPFESRVRQWLGADNSAYDVMFIVSKVRGPLQYSFDATRNANGSWEDMEAWRTYLEKLKVQRLAFGLLMIQHNEGRRHQFTVRRSKGEHCSNAEVEWLRQWKSVSAGGTVAEVLLSAHPRLAANVTLHVDHIRKDNQLVPSTFTFRTSQPFSVEYDCPSWAATLVNHCDGNNTARDLFEIGKRDGWLPLETDIEAFVDTLTNLVSLAILEIEGYPPPHA